jgi:hypothetical protein
VGITGTDWRGPISNHFQKLGEVWIIDHRP